MIMQNWWNDYSGDFSAMTRYTSCSQPTISHRIP